MTGDGPLLQGLYVLIRYEDGAGAVATLEEYAYRRETKPVRRAKLVRGVARMVEVAEQWRILRGALQVDQKAVERLVAGVEKAEAPPPPVDQVDEVEPP